MLNAKEWCGRFRELSHVGLIQAKAAHDQNPGRTPEEVWAACGGTVPLAITQLRELLVEAAGVIAEQHRAIDSLFALCVSEDASFFPSKSGQPWEALLAGNALQEKFKGLGLSPVRKEEK